MGAGEPPFWDASISPGLERDLLAAFYEGAVDADPELREPEGAMGAGNRTAGFMLAQLARSKTFAKIARPAFVGNLKQVTLFLTDQAVKRAVLARVRERVTADTQVVIGHSLGSVVAYEYLCHDQPASVKLLVTAGSPLGIPNVVFHRLTPAPISGKGQWPGTAAAWVNVADRDDLVALRKDLAPLFPGPLPGIKVTDRLVDNGDDPHAIGPYLSARQIGAALGDALRQ